MLRPLLFLLLLPTFSSAAAVLCHPNEKVVLLALASTFYNINPSTWRPDSDCCNWYGVECHETTNYVIGLIFGPYATNFNSTVKTLAKLKHLQYLNIYNAPNFSGQIPSSVQQLSQMRQLFITGTNISGPIPDSIKNLKNLKYLDLSFNRLSGSIPPHLAIVPDLYGILLSGNQLTGTILESFGYLQAVNPTIYLSHNLLSGHIPASLSKIEVRTT